MHQNSCALRRRGRALRALRVLLRAGDRSVLVVGVRQVQNVLHRKARLCVGQRHVSAGGSRGAETRREKLPRQLFGRSAALRRKEEREVEEEEWGKEKRKQKNKTKRKEGRVDV